MRELGYHEVDRRLGHHRRGALEAAEFARQATGAVAGDLLIELNDSKSKAFECILACAEQALAQGLRGAAAQSKTGTTPSFRLPRATS